MVYKDLIDLAGIINSFDCYYEMSDDPRAWEKGNEMAKSINSIISRLDNQELFTVARNLNDHGHKCANRYFKKLIDVWEGELDIIKGNSGTN